MPDAGGADLSVVDRSAEVGGAAGVVELAGVVGHPGDLTQGVLGQGVLPKEKGKGKEKEKKGRRR